MWSIREIFRIEKAIVFGSRTKGNYKKVQIWILKSLNLIIKSVMLSKVNLVECVYYIKIKCKITIDKIIHLRHLQKINKSVCSSILCYTASTEPLDSSTICGTCFLVVTSLLVHSKYPSHLWLIIYFQMPKSLFL